MILMINDRFYNEAELRQLIQSQAEQIRELKKMLLQACSDLDYFASHNTVKCSHHLFKGQACDICPLNSGGDECKWKHEAEALTLIGEDGEPSRNLTDEETEIYESWIDHEAKDTGVNIMDGDAK